MSSSSYKSTTTLVISAVVASVTAYYVYNTYYKKTSKNIDSTNTSTNKKIETLHLPVIDLNVFFDKSSGNYELECSKAADALHKYGCLIVKDSRVTETDNNIFLDMMEKYFENSDGITDARKEYSYQIGVTPEFIEKPRDHCTTLGSLGPDNQPLSPCPPEFDPKWRFFWRIGDLPKETKFPQLNADAVIPHGFPQWKTVMDTWGTKMIESLFTLAEMCEHGFKLPRKSFTDKMTCGPHLLAPTGSNYNIYGQENRVLAGYHYDLNFLTIHGKSRFPGLHIWTRDGKKFNVSVPDGCLLVQAGKQIEYLTGGHVLAGFHEVIVSSGTVDVINKRKKENKSLWRVSSTLFGHIQSDQILEPLDRFKSSPEIASKFPPIYAGDQVKVELEAISLAR